MSKNKPKVILLIINLYFFCCANVNSETLFVALTSKIIRPNSVQNVYVSGDESGSSTKCTVRITHANLTEAVAKHNLEIEPGKTAVVALSLGNLTFNVYNLTVEIQGNKELNGSDRATLHVDRNVHSLFIQSDKPIYKPGESVRFRVIVLDRVLRPLQETPKVNISIFDTSKNLIKNWKNIEILNGILKKTLELSSEPNLGDWQIKVELNSEKSEYTFNVAKYVLPKFKVEVKLPNFITFNNTKLIAEITAAYTYGKSVNQGVAEVTLQEHVEYCYFCSFPKISKTVDVDGGSKFVEFDVKKELNITEELLNEKQFKVEASFTESITGLQQNGSATIKMYKYPYKIQLLNTPSNYKPGFPLNLTLQILTQDDKPIVDDDPNALQISHGFSWKIEDGQLSSPISANGLAQLSFPTPTNEFININTMQVKYKDLTQDIYLPEKFTTPTKIYMQLYRLTNNIKVNEQLKLRVKSNQVLGSVKSVLLCRGDVYSVEKLPNLDTGTLEQEFSVQIPAKCNPHGKVLVYGLFSPNKEIVADSVEFDMETVLENFLNINISKNVVQPGDNLTFALKSKPQSTIALRGVDQSVLLLKKDSDIDIKAVDEILKSSISAASDYRIWGGSNIHKIFDDCGIVILTNGKIDKPQDTIVYYDAIQDEAEISFSGPRAYAMMSYDGGAAKSRSGYGGFSVGESHDVQIRTEFPETWIFDEINGTSDDGGITKFLKTVPDTITSWIITGFSINSVDGLGVSLSPTKLTTFKPFFISLNLPYSVVKGEVFALQVLVHNYLENEVKVDITVDNKRGVLKYIEEGAPAGNESFVKTISVPPSQVIPVSFLVIPIVFGIQKLTVKGVSPTAGDGLSLPLIVKPPGKQIFRNKAVLVDLRSQQKFEKNLTAEFPESRVPGADSIKLTVIGDMLGSTENNLNNLLQLPMGCGEQNMFNFVIDIVVMNYLKSVRALTPAIQIKALNFLETGYQRQLTFLRYDGSFSSFGDSDSFGSTWLTAFVTRFFIKAKAFITIDNKIVTQSLNYLAERQQPHGGFEELGRMHNRELRGGSRSGGLAITAYTCLAFIEASKSVTNFNYTSVLTKGLTYLSNKTNINDPYAVILIAYALQRANHPKKKVFFDLMETLAKKDNDLKYWELPKPPPKLNDTKNGTMDDHHCFSQFRCPFWVHETMTKPATVEMTGYALMTTLLQNKITESIPIARWLTTQRNSQGGFLSTQDTIVGIDALAKFGLDTQTKDSEIKIHVEYSGGKKKLQITDDNELEQQEIALPDNTRWVRLSSMGKGSGLAQLTWSYYIEGGNTSSAFELNIKSKKVSSPKKLWLHICGLYKNTGSSNMVLMEVGLPTGYAFVTELLPNIKSADANILRYELENADTKLVIYFSKLNTTTTCVDLHAFLTHPVAKQAPAHVVVYDYYDTTKQASASYEAPKITICDICHYDKTCKVKNCVGR